MENDGSGDHLKYRIYKFNAVLLYHNIRKTILSEI